MLKVLLVVFTFILLSCSCWESCFNLRNPTADNSCLWHFLQESYSSGASQYGGQVSSYFQYFCMICILPIFYGVKHYQDKYLSLMLRKPYSDVFSVVYSKKTKCEVYSVKITKIKTHNEITKYWYFWFRYPSIIYAMWNRKKRFLIFFQGSPSYGSSHYGGQVSIHSPLKYFLPMCNFGALIVYPPVYLNLM